MKRAVDLSIQTKQLNPDKKVYILGQLIHNNQVIEHLNSLGILTIDKISEISNSICIIRTHGTAPEIIEQLRKQNNLIIDATCPDVKLVQDKAKKLIKEEYKLIIIGKAEHPEVIGIKAHADYEAGKERTVVISSPEEALQLKDFTKNAKIGVVVQTTQKTENFKNILPILAENSKELRVYNTICHTTRNRQKEAEDLATQADLMIVVGGRTSANTTHLAEILGDITQTIHIETDFEVDEYKDLIKKSETIGVTAGASTPQDVIENVIKRIGEYKND